MAEKDEFNPDWVSTPGDTMTDILKERTLSVVEFAEEMGYTPKHANELLHGRTMITVETARKLSAVLGASTVFWMIRESQYREDVARLRSQENGSAETGWLSELPLKDMIKFRWLNPVLGSLSEVAACLRFFDVPDVGAWRATYRDVLETAAFRASVAFDSKPGAVAAWLRQGETESASINCKRWNAKRFQLGLLQIRPLTRKKDPHLFLPELVKRCAECGVAVVILRAPAGCRASGATRFVSPTKALLLLSFRYLSDDHFWFTFFHEAGHLLLHGSNALFLEGPDMASSEQEKEANEFASRVLIPLQFQNQLLNLPVNAREVIRFARLVGVSPGIVVGQLQHLGRFKPRQLNSLKRRFTWARN